MRGHRGDLRIALLAALGASICQATVPLLAREIVDGVILHHTTALWTWITLLLALAAANFVFSYLRRYRGGRVALGVQFDLRNAMHDHLQRMDLGTLAAMSTGQLVARANSDSMLVQRLLNMLPIVSGNVLLLALSLGAMLYLSPLLALISLVVAPTLVLISYRMRRRVFPATWDAQQHEGEVAQIVDEDTNGVRVVKAFGQERRELCRLARSAQALYGTKLRAVRLQARYQPLLQAIPALGQVAILALGGWMAIHQHLSLGTFLAFSAYIAQFVAPARQLAGVLTIGQQARAGTERIFQLLDLTPSIEDRPDAQELTRVDGAISIEGVWFGYTPDHVVLQGLNLQVHAGERVALIGPSGSGKTTVAMLVARFFDPDAGRVLLDGRDVANLRLADLRRKVAFAFEDSFLFSDTVRANIAYGRPDASQSEIEAAARAAQAHDFVTALPDGYETVVGERGLTLSGGQRQRIALARALLMEAPILVLDDATSAVDARIEDAILDELHQLSAGRTTLLIAHRRSTLHLADRVVVLEAGRVIESGTHEELEARSTRYRELLLGLDTEAGEHLDQREPTMLGLGLGLASAKEPAVTASAWRRQEDREDATRAREEAIAATLSSMRPAAIGAGLGGGGGGFRRSLVPTPQLLAQVAALPPVRDRVEIDLPRDARADPRFSLRHLLAEHRRALIAGLVLVVLDALAGLAGPVLVKTGVNGGVAHDSLRVLLAASGVYLLVILADLVDQVLETFVTGRAAEKIMMLLRIRVFGQLQRLSLDYYEREMTGRIMTRMTTDIDQFESLIENGLLSALVALVTFVGVGVALLVMNLLLGAATLIVIVPLSVATVLFRRRAALLYDQSRERIAIVNAAFQESLAGVRESQAFAHESASMEHFHALGRNYLSARVTAQRLVATYFPFVHFLSAIADAIVLGLGAVLIAHGQLTTGALIAFILYIDMFFSPIQQLSQVFDSWQQTRVSVRRIAELMRLEPITPLASPPRPVAHLRGGIEIENLHFRYPSAQAGPAQARRRAGSAAQPVERVGAGDALRGLSLRIEPGETVALVGETGAGKSTVMKLLARFYDPDLGAIRMNGVDLRSLDLEGFRRRIGYVPQEGFLFSGTIRDNIAYGRPDATNATVERAARAVGAHEFIAELPGGYLHELSERGRSLSAGQRQLLALARAELVDPLVLLLDEATANLDLATEARVSAAMQRVASGRTTVVIAHRLQTARRADRIVVLEHGQLAEMGDHATLVRNGGPYARMWRAFETLAGARGDGLARMSPAGDGQVRRAATQEVPSLGESDRSVSKPAPSAW